MGVKVIWLRSGQNSPKTAGTLRRETGNMRGSVSSFPVPRLETPAAVPRVLFLDPQASSRDVLVPAEPNDPNPPVLEAKLFFWCWTPLKSHNMRSHLNLMMLVHQVGGDL